MCWLMKLTVVATGFPTAETVQEQDDELREILERAADRLGLSLDKAAAKELAGRCRGTPRIANRLLRRVRDFAEVEGDGRITRAVTKTALDRLCVDELGLDAMDLRILEAVIHKFDGGPVGLSNLSAAIGEEQDTIEEVYEPFLIQQGFLQRTPRGRIITSSGLKHLGVDRPPSMPEQSELF